MLHSSSLWSNTLGHLFDKGGPVMWPLLIVSILGLAIILERGFFFLLRPMPGKFMAGILQQLKAGRTADALIQSRRRRHPVALITSVYLENLEVPDELRQDILRREGSRVMEQVEQNLRMLSLIAHLSPLIGLLGTVTGLVSSFHVIEKLEGLAQPAQLAAGIWESLLTTVFGLLIAIPCLAAYHGFEQKADRISRRMQFAISELNEFFGKNDQVAITPDRSGEEEMILVHS